MEDLGIYVNWKPNPPDGCGRKWFKGDFLALRAPQITTVRWVLGGIADWADRHGRFCNFPAYGMMGAPFAVVTASLRRQLGIIAILFQFVAALKSAQLAIPTRHSGLRDIFCGLVIAWAVCEVLKRFRLNLRLKLEPAH